MANTDVKWFSFDNTNAPQLTNTWGCLIDVLDACLVTGFGTQLVSNLTILDGVGTATFGSNHNFKQFQVIEFSGSSIPELNKEFKVLGITNNKIEFVVDLPDQSVTGTVSAKLASLGWTKAFAGTQKGVYQAKDKTVNPYFLRVDNSRDPVYTDSYAKFAKVGILDSCSGIDDFSGNQAPFNSANPTKNWVGTGSGSSASVGWFKWHYARGTSASSFSTELTTPSDGNRSWVLVGDKTSFFILPALTPTSTASFNKIPYGFALFRKKDICIPVLVANNNGGGVSTGQHHDNPLLNSTYAGFAFLKNIKNSISNTVLTTQIGGFSTFSGYSGAVTQDTLDGDVFMDIFAKDGSGYLCGVVDLAKSVLHDSSNDQEIKLVTDTNTPYLFVRTATNVVGGASAILKTALAFNLGGY
ncbi:hypothetical protein ACG94V_12540 [Acinetobacter sp. ULE_I001]|uniref:hypothetical protein n=1 Tax=unclassified Acinetobacter TaxID=196816 RepID=UPI003AF5F9D8